VQTERQLTLLQPPPTYILQKPASTASRLRAKRNDHSHFDSIPRALARRKIGHDHHFRPTNVSARRLGQSPPALRTSVPISISSRRSLSRFGYGVCNLYQPTRVRFSRKSSIEILSFAAGAGRQELRLSKSELAVRLPRRYCCRGRSLNHRRCSLILFHLLLPSTALLSARGNTGCTSPRLVRQSAVCPQVEFVQGQLLDISQSQLQIPNLCRGIRAITGYASAVAIRSASAAGVQHRRQREALSSFSFAERPRSFRTIYYPLKLSGPRHFQRAVEN